MDLHRDDKTVLAYRQVPMEVFRRLCSATNPTTYWEDRIVEEYPKGAPMSKTGGADDAVQKFRDLLDGGN